MSIIKIIEQRCSSECVTGFRNGWFDPTESKFFAYAVVLAGDDEFKHNLDNIGSYSYVGLTSDEPWRIYLENGCFQRKSLSQMVEEGTFKWCSIGIYGIFFENNWYIRNQYVFYTDDTKDQIDARTEKSFFERENAWQGHFFERIPEFRMEIDYGEVNKRLSIEYGYELNVLHDLEKMKKYFADVGREHRPMKEELQYLVYRQFVGQPWLVAYEKEEKKRKLNTAFESYIVDEVFVPLAVALNNQWPNEFYKINLLIWSRSLRLIYPNSKAKVLAGVPVTDKSGSETVYYFLFIRDERKFYHWTFSQRRKIVYYFGITIKEDITPLTSWPDNYNMDDPAVTLDEEDFWNEYVFKKENGKYQYLKPIEVKNPQPDIYTQW